MGRFSIKKQEILIFLSSLSPSITCNSHRSICSPSDTCCLTDGTLRATKPVFTSQMMDLCADYKPQQFALRCKTRHGFATFHNPTTPPPHHPTTPSPRPCPALGRPSVLRVMETSPGRLKVSLRTDPKGERRWAR